MPVVTPAGVVGMTVMVSPMNSQVQLITDVSAAVGAMLQRGRVSGLLSGAGNGLCILKFLPVTSDLRRNDIVVTSGQDGVFPEGMQVGTVTREVHESEYYKSVEVKPSENFSMLQQVVFILKANKAVKK
jgi:rod shape-determining protein MreC